ncbi:MAG: glycosyltransferase family 4 protein [Verrucomicrobiota bacterium]
MRIIDIAPNAFLPPRDGADRRAWHLFEGLTELGIKGDFIGRTTVVSNGSKPLPHSPAASWRDHKMLAALVALAGGQDYWTLKMIRPGVRRALATAVQTPFDTVIVNFLYVLPLLKQVPKPYRLLVETHNYDSAIYRQLAGNTRNPGLRALCRRAVANSERALRNLPVGTVLIHVSDRDAELYERHRPDLKHVVVENGTAIKPRKLAPNYGNSDKRVLLFVGSLSAKMNQDALLYFAKDFWPRLRQLGEFRVVGSLPTNQMRALCALEGWTLHENASDQKLDQLYREAHFSILPFAYGEGSKLKLFEACGHGVPVLATRSGAVGVPHLPPLVTVSDEVDAWLARITETRSLPETAIAQTLAFAQEFSWKKLAAKIAGFVEQAPMIV